MRLFVAATILAAKASAQTGIIDGPLLGLLPDASSGAIRSIRGIPGAATLGPSLAGVPVKFGAVGRTYALVVLEGGTAEIVSAAGRRALPDTEPEVSQVALSPRGNAAVVYSRASKSARIFTGLPDAPKLVRVLQIAVPPRALAVADDGESALTIDSHGRAGDAVSLHTIAGAQILYRARHVGAAEFLPGTTRAAIAASGGVLLIAPDLGIETLSTNSDAISLAISADGTKMVIAGPTGRLLVRDLQSAASREVACPCTPGALSPLRGNAVFRLNEPGNGPVWLLDADSVEPRIHFIAAGGER